MNGEPQDPPGDGCGVSVDPHLHGRAATLALARPAIDVGLRRLQR